VPIAARDVVTDLDPSDGAQRSRAAALPPEARRASILENTVPLLLEHGTELSTRQIAEASGIAEGTIFRVFPDKETLIEAAVELALDPAELETEIGAIDPTLPLDVRCEQAVTAIQHRMNSVWRLFAAIGGPTERHRVAGARAATVTRAALESLLEPDRARLRVAPAAAAEMIRSLIIGCRLAEHPATPQQIAAVLLDGLRTPKD
jgi:AcrR family transcriptional regulator